MLPTDLPRGLQRVDSWRGPWPLHDSATTREIERLAAAGSGADLMSAAGGACARLALALTPHARRVVVLAGPGNNGGDGAVAATLLQGTDREVRVLRVGDWGRVPPDAARAWDAAQAAGVDIAGFDQGAVPALGAQDLLIDALLGLGGRRAPEGGLAAAIDAANAQPACRLAVDLPSGLHPDTGVRLGASAVRADATLSLLTLKPGLFTGEGRDHAGAVWWDPLVAPVTAPTAWLAGLPRTRARPHASHKGRFGDVIVVGGAAGLRGAAWLAAEAALASGAGRVFVSLLQAPAGEPPLPRPELMLRPAVWREPRARLAGATVVCGCGGGEAIAAVLPPLLAHAARLVLDADALNAIAADRPLRQRLVARSRQGAVTVLTPHPLEAARLLDSDAATVQADRLAAARSLAHQFSACVVLKGSGSIVATPDRLPSINPTGNAALASGGTGDVLAGWIGGSWTADAEGADVARDAAWLHGAAADAHRATGRAGPLRAHDLIEAMARQVC